VSPRVEAGPLPVLANRGEVIPSSGGNVGAELEEVRVADEHLVQVLEICRFGFLQYQSLGLQFHEERIGGGVEGHDSEGRLASPFGYG
jgi:hypothetical protein